MGSPFDSTTALKTAIFPLLVSLSSCAPAGNLLLTGKLPDPASTSTEPKPTESTPTPAPGAATPASAAPLTEKVQPVLPVDARFTHGQWHLQRTSRALYAWTGTGDQFRLVAIGLAIDDPCWYSRDADRPEARHCPEGDAAVGSVKAVRNGQPVENVFSSGLDKAPWKTTSAETPLAEGKLTLPDAGGGAIGHLEATPSAVFVRTGTERGQRIFTLPVGGNAYQVDGRTPDPFDGCASPNGTVSVIDGVRVQVGKQTCMMALLRDGETNTLVVAQPVLTLAFSRRDEAPNLAGERANAAVLRKTSAGKVQLQLDVAGDATRTVVTYTAKKTADDTRSGVEVNATVGGLHYRCAASVNRFDPAWVQTVKRICSSMTK